MMRIEIGGVGIACEIVGDGARPAVITPGGRYSKDTPGVRELAEKLAAGGFRVLIWDRPNCGESDVHFAGPSESVQNADTLAGLIRALDFGPALLVGGSGGARETLLTAYRHPDVAERAFVLWISGGALGLSALPFFYCFNSAFACAAGGMAAVADLPGWEEPLRRNPANRERMLAQDPAKFMAVMGDWASAFYPQPGYPIPCISAAELGSLNLPVMVLRSGESDINHPRATSEDIHRLIPGATIADPPWGDREWIERQLAHFEGEGLFVRWPSLAKQILEFAAS